MGPARGRCPLDSRSGRCPDNPPGALPLDPAKGLRPSRHPGGYTAAGVFLCGGHGAQRARRDAEIATHGFAPADVSAASMVAAKGRSFRLMFGFLLVATGDESLTPQRLCPRPQVRNLHRRRSGKPHFPRRGAPVARRDPCKGTCPCRDTRLGVERAEGPSRESRGQSPLVGSRGNAPGRVSKGAAPLWPRAPAIILPWV